MSVYEPGQRAVYHEDGASAVVEVMRRTVEGHTEKYALKVIRSLNTSKPHFVGPEGGDKRALEASSFVRGFRPGQELNVDRNLKATDMCWGMWTLTDIVEDTPDTIH